MLNDFFRYKAPNCGKLLSYGFEREGSAFLLRTRIVDDQFLMTVRVFADGTVKTELVDVLTEEPYALHLVEDAAGEFVGRVRAEYERVLKDVAERCFDTEVFQSNVTKQLIARAREKYGDEPEYLWEKFPDNAVLRRKDNGKWYGAILTVAREKLGMAGEGKTEVLDVRADPARIPLLTDGVKVFAGWHMNKKHWISLPLDGSVDLGEIETFLEESRRIAKER